MKNSLIACLLLCFSVSFAQDLYVSTGSYMFVDGTAFTSGPTVAPLYVTNDIELATDGNIYLRNDAQLLQGTDTGNSGIGELSVYQEGNTNQWAYNYWCSPVGGILSDNSINNSFRVNQLDDPLLATLDPIDSNNSAFTNAYNGSASPLTISNRWLYTYQTSSFYSAWDYVGSAGDVNPGLGFTMKGMGTGLTGNQLYDFRGKPNNGTIENDVAIGVNTLIGNPYPSAVDSAAFIHDSDNLASIELSTLLFWDQDGTVASHVLQDYRGGYYSFSIDITGTAITDTPAPFRTYDEQDNSFPLAVPTNGSKIFGRYIPIGQGFMVEGAIGSVGTPAKVTMKNDYRVFEKESATSSIFFRGIDESSGIQYQENGLSIVPEDFKRFRINIDFSQNNDQYTRQLVLNFHDSATMGFDAGLELGLFEKTESDSYFSLEEKMFLAQAFPFTEALKIPLVVDIEQQQPLRFRIFDIQNFEESQGIYMHDKENDSYINLRNLNYELNIEPGHYTDRFEIVFTSENVLDINELDVKALTINQDNGIRQLLVLNPKLLDVSAIEVYDVAGKRLLQGRYDNALDRYELSTSDLSDGVYIVNVRSNTSAVKSQKIIIKN